jgi:hypothetical protein
MTMLRKALFVLSILAAACGPASGLSAPDGFARLGGDHFDDRIGSASGVVVATRVVANDPKANLDFWTQAIDLRLRQRGYVATEAAKDVKNAAGLPGRSLHYTFNDGTRENRYFLDVYATDRRILLVEATGATADFDARLPKVVETMRSARLGS